MFTQMGCVSKTLDGQMDVQKPARLQPGISDINRVKPSFPWKSLIFKSIISLEIVDL